MVSILFVQKNSVYKQLGVDCWDDKRDARNFNCCNAVVAHPPCAQWGRMRALAKKDDDQKQLAPFAVGVIRKCGGVLEHPRDSLLWSTGILPYPGKTDQYGGYSILVNQHWFGHRAEKKTLLYIVGCEEKFLPNIPISFDAVTATIGRSSAYRKHKVKEVTKFERSATPILMAQWLIQVAAICDYNIKSGNWKFFNHN